MMDHSDSTLCTELALHASNAALDALKRVCDTAPEELQLPTILAAVAIVEDKIRIAKKNLAQISPDHAEWLNATQEAFLKFGDRP